MAEVFFDGVGTPVDVPNIEGAQANFFSGLVIFTNALNPREVEFDGENVPVAGGNRPALGFNKSFNNTGKSVILGAQGAQFPADERFFDGVGVPVALGNRSDIGNNFDNRGKNVSYGADNAIFPDLFDLGSEGIPVGDGNQPFFAVRGFDNKGKNVVVTRQAGPPVGSELWKEVTFTGAVINVGNN